MKLVSWNVNGLRACMGKGFAEFLNSENPDVICLQETKMQREQADFDFEGYYEYWNSAEKKGYSGTAIFTKKEPISVSYGIGMEEADAEGRVICAEFEDFYLVTVYTPNAQRELVRIDFRMAFEDAFRAYLMKLNETKPVVVCGDMNVAHKPIDLKNPKTNIGSAGFSYEERGKFSELLASGFNDTFRMLYPDKEEAYSWWSYMFKSRERNTGWRIDYFLVTDDIKEKVKDSLILSDVMGSDHCPVELLLEV
ncbi:MAG: exodeoxyribonuclease III [Clostridia bacterium]|nr:exodeoxyribonuclease III [Clostridia bacterium]